MITVHHLNNSRSQRILWMLEELAQPYEIKRYQRDPKTMLAPETLRNVHPLGKSPVITDGALTVAESGVIIDYLAHTYGDKSALPTPGSQQWIDYNYWLHYAEGSLMPPLLVKLVLARIPILGKAAQKKLQPMIDVHLDYIESELAQRPWFAGDEMTAADIMMSFPLEAARSRAGLDASRPATIAWLEKVHARPAYQAALAKGGPYAYA